jgi:hypothetical protein
MVFIGRLRNYFSDSSSTGRFLRKARRYYLVFRALRFAIAFQTGAFGWRFVAGKMAVFRRDFERVLGSV